jgi:hypothetical protein
VNIGISLNKGFVVALLINLDQLAESLAEKSVEPYIGPFLHATVDDHITNLIFSLK